MRRSIRLVQSLALVAVCLYVLAPRVSAQECPEQVGHLNGEYSSVAVSGHFAYLLSGDFLLIADVSDPSEPVAVGALWIQPPPYIPWWDLTHVTVAGDYAYVTWYYETPEQSHGGVVVVDISTPSSPAQVGDFPEFFFGSCPETVAISGSYAYVATRSGGSINGGGLFVFDVTTPSAATYLGRSGYGYARDVALAGSHAFIAHVNYGLIVVDVATPSAPVPVANPAIPESGYAIAVSDNHAYLTEPPGNLWVIDVSDPTTPVNVGFLATPGSALDVAVSRGYAYVADGVHGLRVIDVSTPSQPVEAGAFSWPWFESQQVALSDGYVYVTFGGWGGMYIFCECSMFSDDFESGDTSAWSATVP